MDKEKRDMEGKKKFHSQVLIPIVTAIVALVFIVIGVKEYGFWKGQPTPGFFPIIIAAALLATSLICAIQLLAGKGLADVKYGSDELMVILGGGAIILCTFLIGLPISCFLYIFLWLRLVEHAPLKHIIIIELVIAFVIIGVFTMWLQVRFPTGLLGSALGL